MTSPPTVAVIGCGPGGMCFLHAVEYHRREMQEKGDDTGIAALPIVTCFERSPAPGGVWRAERKFEANGTTPSPGLPAVEEKKLGEAAADFEAPSTTNMYEALWMNGPKEVIEFFDYTYDDHFGRKLPVYLPRQAMLEYMIARVTRNCPTIFEDYVKFNTTVTHVKYNDAKAKFEVTTMDNLTKEVTTGEYDKCIWAGGNNGKPNMPKDLVSMLTEGGFRGNIVHSSDASNFKENVEGKRVLMIGGAYSSEDLALMAIKLGAEKIYISDRSNKPLVTETTTWPMDKVELLLEQLPVGVRDGHCIQLAEIHWDYDEDQYKCSEEIETEISDIDTVIFCTGYAPNWSMLDESLYAPLEDEEVTYPVPSDWKMKENVLTAELGDIPAPKEVQVSGWVEKTKIYSGLYEYCLLLTNPNMMFCVEMTESPILHLDITAWKMLSFITGKTKVPTSDEMMRSLQEEKLREMEMPVCRYDCDPNYWVAVDNLGDDHWFFDEKDPRKVELEKEFDLYEYFVLARDMKTGHYPVEFGSWDDETLTEIGKAMRRMNWLSLEHRYFEDEKDENEWKWRTFRDYYNGDEFASVFTGTKSVSLKKKWLDIDDAKDDILA